MDEIFLRFPGLGQHICSQLGNLDLIKCREVSKLWKACMDEDRLLWNSIIKQLTEKYPKFQKSWELVISKMPIKMLKEFAIILQNKGLHKVLKDQFHPLHIATMSKNLPLCQYILKKTGGENPRSTIQGKTPLYMAVYNGHLEACKLILDHVEHKNPRDNKGWTPLHLAASAGELDISRMIMENLVDKNPRDRRGETPLHWAAKNGRLDVCRLIIDKVEDKNPADDCGMTPLHWAAKNGHFGIRRLIMKNVVDKNPTTRSGVTPLELAYKYNDLVELFINL